MLKKISFASFLVCCSFIALAQSNVSTITILNQTSDELEISVKIPAPVFNAINTANGITYSVSVNNGSPILKKGLPDLQKLTTSVICPSGKKWEVSAITPGSYIDYNKPVVPSKGNVSRLIDISSLPYTYDSFYKGNSFFPAQLAETREPYALRDFIGQTIMFYPVTYNPSTQTVRKYDEIIVDLKAVPDNSLPSLKGRANKPIVSDYNEIYNSHFLNYSYQNMSKQYTPLGEDGSILVICTDSFMNAMQPYVAWKKEKGIPTTIVPISTIGNSSALIKSYILNYYDTSANLSFVLLVGDVNRVINSSTDNGPSDNAYGYLVGNDSYAEVIIGRFSAQTVSDVTTQVTKTLQYEKYPSPGATWYKTGIGIASYEGYQGIYTYGYHSLADWAFEQTIIRPMLLAYTYTNILNLYDDSTGGPSTQDLINGINNGASIINYTGHGAAYGLETTGFEVEPNNDVADLTNAFKYPFMCVVGCSTGDYTAGSPCLAEALARANNGGQPAGTIASLMSTVAQLWEPPMEGQYAFNRILTGQEPGNIKHTFGGIEVNACMEMNDANGAQGEETTDTWVCFGDPSVVVRTDTPGAITATHPATVPLKTTSLLVNCNTEGALACLTLKGEILTTAYVTGGVANFSFYSITTPDTIRLCITAYNKIPYIDSIPAVPVNEPYLTIASYIINDSTGNNNGMADYGENDGFIMSLKNIGVLNATKVAGVLSTADKYMTITDSAKSFGNIAIGVTTPAVEAFKFSVSDSVPDQHVALFNLRLSDSTGHVWNTPFVITINAPLLSVIAHIVFKQNDTIIKTLSPAGNADTILLITTNIGHSNSLNGTAILTTAGSEVTIINPVQNVTALNVGESDSVKYPVVVSSNATLYSFEDFSYALSTGFYTDELNFMEKIGDAVETFSTGNFNSFNWMQSGDLPWFDTTGNPYPGSTYCARSGHIGNSQSSTLYIQIYSWFDDSISFAERVSSEPDFDFLYFYIDSTVYGQWSGDTSYWHMVSYPVTAGNHTFKWSYVKDVSNSDSDDAGFIDDVTLPLSELATYVTDVPVENDFIIAPNPAGNYFNLQYKISHPAIVSVDIYNMLGQKIMNIVNRQNTDTNMQTLMVNTSGFVGGNYFICFNINGNVYTRKVIVSK